MKKKLYLLTHRVALWLLVSLAGMAAAHAQVPAWQTAVAAGAGNNGGSPDANTYLVDATAADGSGNVYLAGSFAGTATFGSVVLTGGGPSTFVAKWSRTTGTFVWAQRIAATSSAGGSQATALAVSGANVYLAGTFRGTVVFGGVSLTSANMTTELFVAKLADAGPTSTFTWARRTGGTASFYPAALAVSGSSLYLTGSFTGNITFGATVLTSTTAGYDDIFVAKFADAGPGGSFAWAQRAGGSDNDSPTAIAVSGTTVYISGEFASPTATFGTTTIASVGGNALRDVFVAQLTDAGLTGSFGPVQRAGGAGRDRALTNGLAATGNGVYLTGDFDNAVPLTFGSTALPPATNGSILAKWTPASNTFAWVQPAPGSYPNGANFGALATSGTNLYVAGSFAGTVALGTTTLVTALTGDSDLLLAKLLDNGSSMAYAWARQAGGGYPDYARSMVISGSTVYVYGTTGSAALAFGSVTLTNPYFNGQYGSGAFLASLTDATLTSTRPATTGMSLPLFPNPAHDAATVRRPSGGATTLMLTDAMGREVRRYPVPAGSAETALDLRGLPAGLYLLREGTGSQKLLVE